VQRIFLAICLSGFVLGSAHAGNGTPELSSHECGLSTPYNVQVDGGGVWLYRSTGTPQEIFFHDGTLSVDQKVQPVSDTDAARLRQMEDGARMLMPQVAGIAHESIDISFDVLAGVMRTMADSERKARKVEGYRERAQEHIDGSLGNGRWDQDVFDAKFEANVEQVVEEVVGSVTRSVLWAVVTGRADNIDARADRLDQEMDALVEVRSATLEQHAHALCAQVAVLRELQDALEYRYQGSPLVMLAPSPSPSPTVVALSAQAPADVANHDNGDSAMTNNIPTKQR